MAKLYKLMFMVVVRLKGIWYQQLEYIGICYEKNAQVDAIIRRHPSCRWSKSNKCWLIRLSRENYNRLVKQLEGIAGIENAELKSYLANRKKTTLPKDNKLIPGTKAVSPSAQALDISKLNAGIDRNRDIKEVNHHVLPAMEQHLKLKCYSKSTIKTYLNEVAQLLRVLNNRPADNLTEEEIKRYLVYCYEKAKLSENTLHSRINALKFYYEQVVKRDQFFWNIPRPRKHLQIPRLLNEVELARLFNSLRNKKHKAMLFTAYSAGLRVSEVVNLKLENIDSARMQIFIMKSKGKKDRYVNLSPILLDILRDYIKMYIPRPRNYLFESEQTGTAYPVRTVQQIFSNAKIRAGIRKKVGIHSLRHSFATHLLDKGTDIKYIKDLLGHFNIKTTERYLHVSKRQLVNIESPFDDLWKSGGINW